MQPVWLFGVVLSVQHVLRQAQGRGRHARKGHQATWKQFAAKLARQTTAGVVDALVVVFVGGAKTRRILEQSSSRQDQLRRRREFQLVAQEKIKFL